MSVSSPVSLGLPIASQQTLLIPSGAAEATKSFVTQLQKVWKKPPLSHKAMVKPLLHHVN